VSAAIDRLQRGQLVSIPARTAGVLNDIARCAREDRLAACKPDDAVSGPGELASGATALDLSTWAVEWIDAYGCERSRFAAIARIGASPGSAQTAAVHCSRALRGWLASLRSTLVRPRGCSSLKDARPRPKCSLCGSSRRADLASLSATYLSVHLTIGRS
jgi:hypothetical protein